MKGKLIGFSFSNIEGGGGGDCVEFNKEIKKLTKYKKNTSDNKMNIMANWFQ